MSLVKADDNNTSINYKKIEFVSVNDPNNKADPETGLGAVQDPFQIGIYKVTAKQYSEFLSSVAAKSDPHHLFDDRMETDAKVACIRKTFNKERECYEYIAIPGREDFPITYVDLFCCAYFCNWLTLGCPSGEESSELIQHGAYTITQDSDQQSIETIPGSPFFLPTEDQWYKAAYYHHNPKKIITYDPEDPIASVQDSGSFLYWNYPTQTMSEPWNRLGSSVEAANYFRSSNWWYSQYTTGKEPYLTPVGTFQNTPGPYGTFDMGGDVNEWTFSLHDIKEDENSSTCCFIRGGSWASGSIELDRKTHHDLEVTAKNNTTGFRVASQELVQVKQPTQKDLTSSIIANTIAANAMYRRIGEVASYFILQEFFEISLIYDAAEGGRTLAYFKCMLPLGGITTVLDWLWFGFDDAFTWGAQWLVHMSINAVTVATIDRLGMEEAQRLAVEWGFRDYIDFFKVIQKVCHEVLDPVKSFLRANCNSSQ
jgi:formylglycine-generating enzyme required for sulfatase activity